jgi:hypothetical protein
MWGLSILTLVFGFALAGCGGDDDPTSPSGGDTDKELAGTIHISTTSGGTVVAATATTSDTLYAVWTAGADDPATITYQWKDASGAISGETSTTYQPSAAGSYTVTVSATGYKGKTSEAVTVTPAPAMTWTPVTNSGFEEYDSIFGVVYGNNKFVAWGGYSDDLKIGKSTDGVSWTATTGIANFSINDIAYGNNTWVAVGRTFNSSDPYMVYSTDDCVSWVPIDVAAAGFSYPGISGVAYGGTGANARFVAVGSGSKISTSADGISWTPADTSGLGSIYIYGVAYGDGKFVAVGGDTIAYSTDNGATWTAADTSGLDGNEIYAIAYGNGTWVAGGDTIAYSTDGETWTAVDESSTSFFGGKSVGSVAYGSDKWVVAAGGPNMGCAIATSPDGIAWTEVTQSVFTPGDPDTSVNGVAYGNGKFVAVGRDGHDTSWNKIAYSED